MELQIDWGSGGLVLDLDAALPQNLTWTRKLLREIRRDRVYPDHEILLQYFNDRRQTAQKRLEEAQSKHSSTQQKIGQLLKQVDMYPKDAYYFRQRSCVEKRLKPELIALKKEIKDCIAVIRKSQKEAEYFGKLPSLYKDIVLRKEHKNA